MTIKLHIDLANSFHKNAAFGVGLLFLPFIFMPILAFDSSVFADGSFVVYGEDPISRGLDGVADSIHGSDTTQNQAPRRDPNALEKLNQLNALHEAGVLSDEEFNAKKAELLSRI